MSVRQNSNSCRTTAFSSCCCWSSMPPNMSWRPSISRHSPPSGKAPHRIAPVCEGSVHSVELSCCTYCPHSHHKKCFECRQHECCTPGSLFCRLQQYLPHPETHQSAWLCVRLAGTHLPSHLYRQDARAHSTAEGIHGAIKALSLCLWIFV